jgi:stress-induced morphogen
MINRMATADVKELLIKSFDDAYVDIAEDSNNMNSHLHLNILIVCDQFKEKKLLDQHRMVMDILREALQDDIHAVKIKTLTKDKARQQNIEFE